jgi:hypothetical protein
MFSFSLLSSVAALHSYTAATHPSTIPPAPTSGVKLRAAIAGTTSNPSTALPCATYWAGGAAAAVTMRLGPQAQTTLRPSQVLSVAADELDWLFEHTDDEADAVVVQARASIEAWMSELSDAHQAAIAAQHCPLAWPEELPGHEEDSFALVLWLLCPSDRRALRANTAEQLELRARRRLEIALEREGAGAIRALIRRARWLYEEAVRAYAEVRGRVPSVIPAGSTGFASSLDESCFEGAA